MTACVACGCCMWLCVGGVNVFSALSDGQPACMLVWLCRLLMFKLIWLLTVLQYSLFVNLLLCSAFFCE